VTHPVNGPATRRELVGSTAAALAAAGLLGAEAARAAGPPPTDADVLRRTLQIERVVVIAYRQAIASDALAVPVARQLEQILGQEHEHVAILEAALRSLGEPPPPPPTDLPAAQRLLTSHHVNVSLLQLRTQDQCLRLLVNVETLAEEAYFTAVGQLSDAALLRTSTQIMGCEAQHWTVLSTVKHHGDVMMTVPYPFVGGPL
jgi:hypothetical protein